MIRFEIFSEKEEIPFADIDEVAVIADASGIEELCRSLERLKAAAGPDHLHLSIYGCGDIDLDTNPSGMPHSALIPQVRIVKAGEEENRSGQPR